MLASKLESTILFRKVYGCLTAGAIGDAMGMPIEGWTYEKIQEEHGWVNGLDESRGWTGEYTDDTYLKNKLCEHYIARKKHFTAADVVEMWAELEPDKLWFPEQYTHLLAAHSGTDPFFAGKGNMVVCGAAMHIAPVGLVNAGNAEAAYREATSVAAINSHSYGLEGAAVLAAGIAEAMLPDADPDSVFKAALAVAHDGTKKALAEVYAEVQKHTDVGSAILPVREITTRWDGRLAGTNPNTEDKERCLEEVAAAFAMFYLAGDNVMTAVEGGVNFGQDNDSIAGMAGALAGALYGGESIPAKLIEKVEAANDYDSRGLALRMCQAITEIQDRDVRALARSRKLWE